ncbi:MAG: tRNA (guanine-N1)-methyltransferase [Nitrospira bacterium SM23_35]|jgi:tRNA (guanine37-N1)-methyltransferase|nr:MAG: tRNA (guanine-N1)-methyltransferase [Nitrospira bacterium SM23_35]
MKCDILTIFPDIFHAYLGEGILRRAIQNGFIQVDIHHLREYTADKHRTVDDYPYGGGSGMVMKPEPFFSALEAICPDRSQRRVLMLSPAGRKFDQHLAEELSRETRRLVFLCGRYEAVDERVRIALTDDEISIGDYVLTGGELPALVIIDAVARLVPGVLGDEHSAEIESFSWGILDYPHYTRPPEFRGLAVPEILLSGNHKDILRWRRKQALLRTLRQRPELLEKAPLSEEDLGLMREIKEESA